MCFDIVELDVPYAKRQLAIDNCCFWNKERRRWCTCDFNKDKVEKIMKSELISKLNDKKQELLNKSETKIISETTEL
jgi:hypothetical protein